MIVSPQMFQQLLADPQKLNQLANSPVDPNAVMKHQMGGPMPELPGVHMGTANPPVAQPPVASLAKPQGDAWQGLAGMGLQTMQAAQPQQVPIAPAPFVGQASQTQAPNYGTPIRPTRTQGLDALLASFRR